MEGTNHVFITPERVYYTRWADSAEIYLDYLKSAEKDVKHVVAEEVEVEHFELKDVQHVTLCGREIVRGTIYGTIPIKLQFEVQRNPKATYEWSISETFYVINDEAVPGEYSTGLREILFDVIRELEYNGSLEIRQEEFDHDPHDDDEWKDTETFRNRHTS